jgi:hypothetical protein
MVVILVWLTVITMRLSLDSKSHADKIVHVSAGRAMPPSLKRTRRLCWIHSPVFVDHFCPSSLDIVAIYGAKTYGFMFDVFGVMLAA